MPEYLILPVNPDLALTELDALLSELDEPLYQRAMIQGISCPDDRHINPKWNTPIGQIQLNFVRLCLSEFIKRRLNRDFQPGLDYEGLIIEFDPNDSELFKKLVSAEVTLWIAVWRLLSELRNYGGRHPAFVLKQLLGEPSGLVIPMFRLHSTNGKDGADAVIRQLQIENHQLDFGGSELENPFDANRQPMNYWFASAGKSFGEQSDEGRKDWNAIVKARKSLTASIATNKPRTLQKDGSEIKRGRPKKDSLPTVDGTEEWQQSFEDLKSRGFIFNIS
ncbi:MAG: hypothetical protein NT070_14165 [Cyanobacteria bacterium]|nr:hypothetical protein [Cyanobacteriota bacterium]